MLTLARRAVVADDAHGIARDVDDLLGAVRDVLVLARQGSARCVPQDRRDEPAVGDGDDVAPARRRGDLPQRVERAGRQLVDRLGVRRLAVGKARVVLARRHALGDAVEALLEPVVGRGYLEADGAADDLGRLVRATERARHEQTVVAAPERLTGAGGLSAPRVVEGDVAMPLDLAESVPFGFAVA